MAMTQKTKKCRICGRPTLHARAHFGAGWGFLLSVITGGLFLPIWFLIGFCEALTRFRCQVCGDRN